MRQYTFRSPGRRATILGAADGYDATVLGPKDSLTGTLPPPGPAVPRPGKIVCVGLNYRSHVTEGAGRDVPDRPLLFSKFANAVVADGEPIVRPEGCRALDLEVELGVVIGRQARRVAAGAGDGPRRRLRRRERRLGP